MHIYVYVFGPSVGESIILQYPNSSNNKYLWGVIDCYSERILDFLQNDRDVQKLEFVCWTHPHADHHDGMPALLQTYRDRIHRFWRFGGNNAKSLLAFCYRWPQTNIGKVRNIELSTIEEIFRFASEQRKRKRESDSFKKLTDIHSLINIEYDKEFHFRISSLSPSSRLAEEYTSHIAKCLETPDAPDWETFNGAHNSVSVVLLVEFGKTRLLFGADAEQKVWSDIVSSEERQNQPLTLSSHFVKISHHGSENAYHKDAWAEIAQHANPLAVLTPFMHSQLPTNEGIVLLKKHCRRIYQTATRKNYQYHNIPSVSIKLKYKWKTTSSIDYCTFEFDHLGNLIDASLSDTAVVFSDS